MLPFTTFVFTTVVVAVFLIPEGDFLMTVVVVVVDETGDFFTDNNGFFALTDALTPEIADDLT